MTLRYHTCIVTFNTTIGKMDIVQVFDHDVVLNVPVKSLNMHQSSLLYTLVVKNSAGRQHQPPLPLPMTCFMTTNVTSKQSHSQLCDN